MELIEDNLIDSRLRTRVSKVYFGGKLMDLSSDMVDEYLRNGVADDIFLENFEGELLEILDQVTGNLIHQLINYEFLDSLDWQWMYDSAQNRFREGRRHTVIFVSANGQVSLGQIEEGLGFVLSDLWIY